MKSTTALTWARKTAQIADEKLGQDILVLDVRGQSSITDCFVFISATSHLHVRALEDAIRDGLREAGAILRRTDGQRGHVWRVLDYGTMMVHVMDQKTRLFYSIERLWDEGKKVSFAPAAKKSSRTRPSKGRVKKHARV